MAGGRPFDRERFVGLIHYIGQTPIRSGRVGLAVVIQKSDFEAYAKLGKSITGATYVKAREPGQPRKPKGLLDAVVLGWRWGAASQRIMAGRLRRRDAEWIADQWRGEVPV